MLDMAIAASAEVAGNCGPYYKGQCDSGKRDN